MDRRAFIGAAVLMPMAVACPASRRSRARGFAGHSSVTPHDAVDCFGDLPWDHPVVEYERWREQAHMALSMGRHPETWQIVEFDYLERVKAEYEHLLEISEAELPALVYEWENA